MRPCRSKADIIQKQEEVDNCHLPRTYRPLPPIRVPKAVQEIIDYWEAIEINGDRLRRSQPGSDAHRWMVTSIKKVLTHKHYAINQHELFKDDPPSKEFIFARIIDHAKQALNPSYCPYGIKFKRPLRNLSLGDFFHQRIPTSKYMCSRFLYITDNPITKSGMREGFKKNKHPRFVQALIEIYRKVVLGGVEYDPTISDLNKFITAADRYYLFLKDNQWRLPPFIIQMTDEEKAHVVFKASVEGVDKKYWFPGVFSSDTNFQSRIPAFFVREGMLTAEDAPNWRY